MVIMAEILNAKQRKFQKTILNWFTKHQRDLPWRKTRDPYKIFVSEVMLQQTQVERVMPKYRAFLHVFPTIQKLASADRSSVIKMWSGLGYNNRAVRLHRAAQEIVQHHKGALPCSSQALDQLPGIGTYTARAIQAFAFNKHIAAVDVNHARVVRRMFYGTRTVSAKELDPLCLSLIPMRKAYAWNHALMDFGALVCRNKPRCDICPLRSVCSAYPDVLKTRKQNKKLSETFLGSNRYFRGRIVEALRNVPDRHIEFHILWQQIDALHPILQSRFRELIRALESDHVVTTVRIRSRVYVELA